jgi:hypothetical protein
LEQPPETVGAAIGARCSSHRRRPAFGSNTAHRRQQHLPPLAATPPAAGSYTHPWSPSPIFAADSMALTASSSCAWVLMSHGMEHAGEKIERRQGPAPHHRPRAPTALSRSTTWCSALYAAGNPGELLAARHVSSWWRGTQAIGGGCGRGTGEDAGELRVGDADGEADKLQEWRWPVDELCGRETKKKNENGG